MSDSSRGLVQAAPCHAVDHLLRYGDRKGGDLVLDLTT
jgi:hypothetical protein